MIDMDVYVKTDEIVMLLLPLIIIQLAVQIWAVYDVLKKKKTKNLSVPVWIVIIAFGEIVGSIIYFIIGRSEE